MNYFFYLTYIIPIFIFLETKQIISLNFIAIGDWGYRNNNQQKLAKAISKFIENKNKTFIVSTGDNFYSDGVKSIYDEKWNDVFENSFHHKSFRNKRWYITVGNHDYAGYGWKGVQAQIDYTKMSNRWYFPNNYYTESMEIQKNFVIQFVFIDTHQFSSKQQKWIRSTLSSSKAQYLFVVGHYPVYSAGKYGNIMEFTHLPKWFRQYEVTAYICGHEHHLQYIHKNGIEYFISGAGADVRYDDTISKKADWFKKEYGFLWCEINDHDLKGSCYFMDYNLNIFNKILLKQRYKDKKQKMFSNQKEEFIIYQDHFIVSNRKHPFIDIIKNETNFFIN